MNLPSPGFLLRAFLQVCHRFPSTMLAAATGVVVLILLIERSPGPNEESLTHIWMVAQLGLALLTGIVAFAESAGWSAGRKWSAQGIGLALLAGYEWYLSMQPKTGFDILHVPRYILFLLAAHLFVSVAPYLNRRSVADFWEYNRRLFANFVVGATFTFILFAGLGLAILAVDKLFAWDAGDLIYVRLFVLLAGIFNTSYFLYHFPEKYEFETEDASYNAVFRNLCKYILIPIVGLYFLILYAYGAKIVATWSLPRGFVGSLVIGFSVAGIFTYLLNFYLPQFDDTKIVSGYKKWFWPVVLPLTALLFAAIGKRIADYGVTEPRYIVLTTGIWLAAVCIYFLVSKSDNIKFIPISLGISTLIVAIGPLSAFSVAERSQTNLLQKILERNGRWENGRIKSGSAPMLQTETTQVESILEYFERREQLKNADWMPMPADSFPEETYSLPSNIVSWLGIRGKVSDSPTFMQITGNRTSGKTDIRGFTQFYPIDPMVDRNSDVDNGYFFIRSEDGKKLLWLQARNGVTGALDSFNLQPALINWRSQTKGNHLQLEEGMDFIDVTCAKGTARIRIEDAQLEINSDGLHLSGMNGSLFLREK